VVDPSQHADSRGIVESILRKIPGFRGYLEKEYRRESDHLARTWLADQVDRCKTGLDRYQRALLDAGQIDNLDECERVRTRLDTLGSRIRGAVRGYSGIFDFVRVDEDLLDDVYDHDTSLIDHVTILADSIDALSPGADAPPKVLADLLGRVEELHREFDKRSELLEGLGPGTE
jgi:hypothetical protein